MPTKNAPAHEQPATVLSGKLPELRSKKQQSQGAVLSIIIIMIMVVLGAYYSFERRIDARAVQTSDVELGSY